ncbi:rhomboid family intramembrane serine protease [Algivirga pacifica]|uniref:Rhomboid family intramembrane serine protease n=1 Tax=Algivirga pacifica TaxID=1162670 RepID=A0ABP9DA24_9BACT
MNSFVRDFKTTWNKPNNSLPRLIIINVVAFVAMSILSLVLRYAVGPYAFERYILEYIALPSSFLEFITKPWTLVTYFFTHSLSHFLHIVFNMLGLYWFGVIFMEYLGNKKLVDIYVLGGLAGGLIYMIAYFASSFMQNPIAPPMIGLIGASACVYAIIVGAATVAPDYRMNLLFIGPVKIVYLALAYIFMNVISLGGGDNFGGHIAHLGGALTGFIYVKSLKKGVDLGSWVSNFLTWITNWNKPSRKFKVTHRGRKTNIKKSSEPDQAMVDAILDKISERGYENLTQEEKEILFKASQKKN